MSEPEATPTPLAPAPRDLDFEQARLAYSIIERLLEHIRIVSDLVGLMGQTIDEDTAKALTATPYWAAYLDSRRALQRTHQDVEKLADAMTELTADEAPPMG